MMLAGALLHLAALLAPVACLGIHLGTLRASLSDGATLSTLAGATALYFGDAVTMSHPVAERTSVLDENAKRWAAATGTALLTLLWVSLAERSLHVGEVGWVQGVGALFLVVGIALRASAVRTLGIEFRTELDVSDTSSLVQRGVYRYLRHPSETGLLAAGLGAALLLFSPWGLWIWCGALLPTTLKRLSLEERSLEKRFGRDYRVYAQNVGGVVPRAWERAASWPLETCRDLSSER